VSRVLVKLSARDRTHAAVRALELGLLEWPATGNHR
jgi:DNA-binding NarL/FixJ family response regulator